MGRVYRTLLCSLVATGCYSGVSADSAGQPESGDDSAATATVGGDDSDVGGGETGGSDTGDDPPPSDAEVGVPRLWRLSASQYERTAEVALGIEVDLPRIRVGGRAEDFINYASGSSVDEVFFANLEEDLYTLVTENVDAVAAPLSCTLDTLDRDCLSDFLGPFLRQAHRTDATDPEPYLSLYDNLAGSQGQSTAFASVVVAVLLSPKAFFRTELGANDAEVDTPLTPFEIAENLAYTVWNGPPDEALFAAAGDGSITDPEVFATHLDRMLESPDGNRGMVEFLSQWLGLAGLSGMDKDPTAFPEFDDELRDSMIRETHDLFEFVLDEPGSDFRTLLTTQKTFADARLAELYGVGAGPMPDGSTQLPVSERRGVFTTPAVIVAMSDASSTAVIYRGKALLNRMLCRSLPPRPAGVEATPPPGVPADATTRQKLESIEEQVPCNICHIDMHPFSFAMEQYDAIGRFRETENDQAIDPSGQVTLLSSGTAIPFADVRELIDKLADEPDLYDCLVKQGVRYTFGTPEAPEDNEDFMRIREDFRESRNIRALFRELVTTAAFRGRAKVEENECLSP